MPEDNRMLDESDLGSNSHNGNGSVAIENETDADTADDDSFSKLVMLPFTEARARALEEFDRKFLSAALARHNGNIARTARALGLHRQSLQKLMARRGLKSVRVPPANSNADT